MKNYESETVKAPLKDILPKINWLIYNISRFLIKIVFQFPLFFKVTKINWQVIPEEGPVILVCTHKNWKDIPFSSIVTNRTLRYIAKKELFENILFSWWYKKTGAIAIDRINVGLSTIRQAICALKNNNVLVVFPEGTRVKSDNIGKINEGTASIALLSKVDPKIIPISIKYKKGWFLGFPIIVSIKCGKLIQTSEYQKRQELTKKLAESLQTLHQNNII